MGSDKVKLRIFSTLPWQFTTKNLTIFLWNGCLSDVLLSAKTGFITKKKTSMSSGELRPIIINNFLLKIFTKIIARRIQSVIELDPRQKGFMPVDGWLENTRVLDLVMKGSWSSMPLALVAYVDHQKAFNLTTHVDFLRAVRSIWTPYPNPDICERYVLAGENSSSRSV